MGRDAVPGGPVAQHVPRPSPHTRPDRSRPLPDADDVFPVTRTGPADDTRPGRGPGRRRALTALGVVAAAGAGAVAFGPATAREVVRDLTGGADPADAEQVSARLAASASSGGSLPAAPGGTTATVEYQAAGAGKAPAATTAAVSQPATPLALDQAVHLARRATWGPNPSTVAAIRTAGVTKWVDAQLSPAKLADKGVDALLPKLTSLGRTPAQIRATNASRGKQDYFYAHTELELAAIIRQTWSTRQLFEVVVDFWHSRLHVPGRIDKSRDSLNHYDKVVIRGHAFGTFEAMLWSMVRHPAMLLYLDNQQNTKFGGNQNLGRELLELHTLGVDAGYTQADVEGAARLLTGLTVDEKTMTTVFRPENHYVGPVRVFGTTYPNTTAAGGMTTLKALVRNLARHPKTAEYLCTDLARRFVSDAPPKALVARLAKTYLANGTAIRPVLRQLLLSAEFKASVGQKYRRPLEHTVATIRALSVKPAADTAAFLGSLRDLRWALEQVGQTPFGWSTPDGYPDFAQPWLSTVGTLNRWNLNIALAGGWYKGLTKPPAQAIIGDAKTYGVAVDRLAKRLLYQAPTAAQKAALLTFLGQSASTPIPAWARTGDYNLLVRLPALLLGSPAHQLR